MRAAAVSRSNGVAGVETRSNTQRGRATRDASGQMLSLRTKTLDVRISAGISRADPRLSGMRVLLLSARGQARDREAGEQAGADEYLIKPFSPLQLVETIERLLPGT